MNIYIYKYITWKGVSFTVNITRKWTPTNTNDSMEKQNNNKKRKLNNTRLWIYNKLHVFKNLNQKKSNRFFQTDSKFLFYFSVRLSSIKKNLIQIVDATFRLIHDACWCPIFNFLFIFFGVSTVLIQHIHTQNPQYRRTLSSRFVIHTQKMNEYTK